MLVEIAFGAVGAVTKTVSAIVAFVVSELFVGDWTVIAGGVTVGV
jgi:hypothetical protein